MSQQYSVEGLRPALHRSRDGTLSIHTQITKVEENKNFNALEFPAGQSRMSIFNFSWTFVEPLLSSSALHV